MRYPNLRYGNPTEMAFYTVGVSLPDLARRLRRDERTVRDWLSGKRRVPWWVPELLRLRHEATAHYMRSVSYETHRPVLGSVTRCGVIELRPQDVKKPQTMTELRLSDFDPVDLAISSCAS
jgi:hypothetical protein